MAQNTVPFQTMVAQGALAGSDLAVQVIPSGEVAQTLDAFTGGPEIARNSEPFQEIAVQ